MSLCESPRSFSTFVCLIYALKTASITLYPFSTVHTEKMTKKKPCFGAIPCLNMPKRSHERAQVQQRPARSVVNTEDDNAVKTTAYKNFSDVCKRITSLKSLSGWNFQVACDRLIMTKMKDNFLLPEREIIVDDSLGFTIKVFGCFLPENHAIYTEHMRSINNIRVNNIVKEMDCYSFCCGVKDGDLSSQLVHHVIPVSADPLAEDDQGLMFPHKQYWRSKECYLLCIDDDRCEQCESYMSMCSKVKITKEKRLSVPAKLNAPVSKTALERIKLTLQGQRLKCAQLEQ